MSIKKKISAEIIADSKNEFGERITTFVVTFPRIVLAELNTHRVFSRNSASSRAIPFEKMVKMVQEDPFIPIAWQKDHKGMQGKEYFDMEGSITKRESYWLHGRNEAVKTAKMLGESETTKQLCNRLLEPFMWHTAIITATEYENFFVLRCPQYTIREEEVFRSRKDFLKFYQEQGVDIECIFAREEDNVASLKSNTSGAEIHISRLAECMWDAFNESKPKKLKAGEWHIPFGDNIHKDKLSDVTDITDLACIKETYIKIATARCARVSYFNFEGKDDYEADIKLHDRLASMGHWSPFEHCAKAMNFSDYDLSDNKVFHKETGVEFCDGWSGNFRGFIQYRKMFNNENITK